MSLSFLNEEVLLLMIRLSKAIIGKRIKVWYHKLKSNSSHKLVMRFNRRGLLIRMSLNYKMFFSGAQIRVIQSHKLKEFQQQDLDHLRDQIQLILSLTFIVR